MKKTTKLLTLILAAAMLALCFALPAYGEDLTVDLSGGKDAACFEGLKVTTHVINITSGSTPGPRTYEGVLLSDLLESLGVALPAAVAYNTSDSRPGERIIDADNDFLLAWSRVDGGSPAPESPIRICPFKESALSGDLIQMVIELIITPADSLGTLQALQALYDEEAEKEITVSKDGWDVMPGQPWMKEADKAAYDEAMASAKGVLDEAEKYDAEAIEAAYATLVGAAAKAGSAPALVMGDADCNGTVNAGDAARILRCLVRLDTFSERGRLQSLLTGGSAPSASDAARILRWLVRLEVSLVPVETLTVDFTDGKDAACFEGLTGRTLAITASNASGTSRSYHFSGYWLSDVLEKVGISAFTKIEAVTSDIGTLDITALYKRDGEIMLAWGEGDPTIVPETPIRICPVGAQLANELSKNVVRLVITYNG